MTKDDFLDIMEKAIEKEEGIEVCVDNPELRDFEAIRNSHINVKQKAEYYDKAYNENMELHRNTAIRIVYVRLIDKRGDYIYG